MARSLSSPSSGKHIPSALAILLFSILPTIIEKFSTVQMTSDLLVSLGKPKYLLNIKEEFDYIIGKNLEYTREHWNQRCCKTIIYSYTK